MKINQICFLNSLLIQKMQRISFCCCRQFKIVQKNLFFIMLESDENYSAHKKFMTYAASAMSTLNIQNSESMRRERNNKKTHWNVTNHRFANLHICTNLNSVLPGFAHLSFTLLFLLFLFILHWEHDIMRYFFNVSVFCRFFWGISC